MTTYFQSTWHLNPWMSFWMALVQRRGSRDAGRLLCKLARQLMASCCCDKFLRQFREEKSSSTFTLSDVPSPCLLGSAAFWHWRQSITRGRMLGREAHLIGEGGKTPRKKLRTRFTFPGYISTSSKLTQSPFSVPPNNTIILWTIKALISGLGHSPQNLLISHRKSFS